MMLSVNSLCNRSRNSARPPAQSRMQSAFISAKVASVQSKSKFARAQSKVASSRHINLLPFLRLPPAPFCLFPPWSPSLLTSEVVEVVEGGSN
jgi:hypothetical protein